ncbi:MAG: MscL family protein [Thermales bacterium]|nr:MscL family protein [Thermales bacterium]
MAFVKGFGVIGLALGVVIGGAANTIVKSLVDNIIQPLLGYIGGLDSLSEWTLGKLYVGAFVGDLIEFLVLLFVVYMAVKIIISRFLTKKERETLGI